MTSERNMSLDYWRENRMYSLMKVGRWNLPEVRRAVSTQGPRSVLDSSFLQSSAPSLSYYYCHYSLLGLVLYSYTAPPKLTLVILSSIF